MPVTYCWAFERFPSPFILSNHITKGSFTIERPDPAGPTKWTRSNSAGQNRSEYYSFKDKHVLSKHQYKCTDVCPWPWTQRTGTIKTVDAAISSVQDYWNDTSMCPSSKTSRLFFVTNQNTDGQVLLYVVNLNACHYAVPGRGHSQMG